MSPPVSAPVHFGVPSVAVEQNEAQMPDVPMMRQVLPGAHSLAFLQVSPGLVAPRARHCGPVYSEELVK